MYIQYNIIQSLKNKVLIHATTWMILKNIMSSERSQSQKGTCYMIIFIYEIFRIGKSIDTDNKAPN